MAEPSTTLVAASVRHETIGRSAEGRRLRVRYVGDATATLRVLVVAGQHGDERLAGEAVKRWTRQMRAAGRLPPTVQLALLRSANPDGAAHRSRRNAQGLDLNRDHQLLNAPETHALHAFVRRWKPQLVIDVHTYPPRRGHLLARGLAHCQDVYLDRPTHLCLAATHSGRLSAELLAMLLQTLPEQGVRAARYTLVTRAKRVRHSTPDVVDLRNSLALRYGAPTLLIEGREPRGEGRAGRQRTRQAIVATLDAALDWATTRGAALADLRPQWSPGMPIAICSEYVPARERCTLTMADMHTGAIRTVQLPELYTPEVRPTEHAQLPAAYAVPRRLTRLLELLDRHGFVRQAAPAGSQPVEAYDVRYVLASRRPRRAPLALDVRRTPAWRTLENYWLLPVTAENGAALAVLLEPASKYGLVRHPQLGLKPAAGQPCPILRVMEML